MKAYVTVKIVDRHVEGKYLHTTGVDIRCSNIFRIRIRIYAPRKRIIFICTVRSSEVCRVNKPNIKKKKNV